MADIKWKTMKVDAQFAQEMKEIAKMRYIKNLAKKEPSGPEMTRLLMRTPEFKFSLNKLKNLPKKEDII